jgi:hypothetical protein
MFTLKSRSLAERTGMKHNLYEHLNFCTLHLSFLPSLPHQLDNSKMPHFKEIFGDDKSANDERKELLSSPHQKDNIYIEAANLM